MSIFRPQDFPCPQCDHPVTFDVVESVNADRRPDLREQILKGRFQRGTCGQCGTTFRVEPQMTYFDGGRKQWILVQPADQLAQWPTLEGYASDTFAVAYGEQASPMAQSIGRGLQVRVTFGWPALREKLLCAEHDLDDVALELVKISLVRGMESSPLADDVELRLTGVDGPNLVLSWVKPTDEQARESLTIPRALYDEIAADTEGYRELREQLTAGPFVDFNRLLVEATKQVPS